MSNVTLKSNSDEALSNEFLFKSNGDEALNDVFLKKETAMKRLTFRKNGSDEAFNTSLPCFIASLLHRCQHYINPCRNRHKTGQNFSTHMSRQ